MAKNIIITCGTSLISKLFDEDFYDITWWNFSYEEIKHFKWDITELSKKEAKKEKINIDCDDDMWECEKEESFKKFLLEKIKWVNIDSNFFKKLSAEITTILKLDTDKENDNIYLFYSDTLLWQVVVEILEEVFEEKIWIKKLELKKINWFQTEDAQNFQQQAIKNYFQILEEIKNTWTEIIMCPVGGYKSLIPYSSLYAMVNWWDIKYIYEDSDEILDLPGGMLSYLLLKAWIKDNDFKDVIKELWDWENSIFSQKVDGFENIVKLSEATNRFIELWDLSGFGWIEFKDNENLNKLLKKFVEFDKKIKFWQIRDKQEIENIIEEINNFEWGKNNILKPIFDKLVKEFEIFHLKNEIEFYFSILTFYQKHKMYLQGFLFMREYIVDLFIHLSEFSRKYIGKSKIEDSEKDDERYFMKEKKWFKLPWLFRDLFSNNIICSLLGKTKKQKFEYYIIKKDSDRKKIKDENWNFMADENNKKEIVIQDIYYNKIRSLDEDNKKDLKDAFYKLREIRNYFAHAKFSKWDECTPEWDEFTPEKLSETFENYYNILKIFKNHVLHSDNQKN